MPRNNGKKPSLLDDSSDSEIDFTINKDYAERYDKWRQKEEHQKLKDRYGDDLSSSSSESEEEEPIIEKDFLKTLSLLKSKDPQIYDESKTFFTEIPQAEKKHKEKKSKPVYLKDYERELILEKNGELGDEEDYKPQIQPTYDEEQKQIKDSFKAALMNSDSDDDTLLQVRVKDERQREKEEEEYIQWLKGVRERAPDWSGKTDLKFLHDYWNDPDLDENELFLKDFILNKKYINDDKSDAIPFYEEITNDVETLSDDEKQLEKQAVFEHKYNFRFEEPDSEFIKQYPRTIGDSLRKKDNKRKIKREEYQERKRLEKEEKKEEIKKLKAIMRKEMEEKWNKLKEITGNDELNFDELDLEGDFDPQEHDKKMQELFNEEYYNVEEQERPELPSDEEFECDNWDNWTGADEGQAGEDDDEPHCEDPNFVMDADYDPKLEFQKQMMESSKSKRKQKKSKFAAALSTKKPVFDPAAKSFERYFDEYYKLDCEDIVGDLPVRYKYHQVIPNNFGLSVDEVLAAKDKELNRWCSIKKTCQYRSEAEEVYDVHAFKKRAQNEALKKKIFLSLAEKSEDQEPKASTSVNDTETSKKKRKKKKSKLNKLNNSETNIDSIDVNNNSSNEDVNQKLVAKQASTCNDDELVQQQERVVARKKKEIKLNKFTNSETSMDSSNVNNNGSNEDASQNSIAQQASTCNDELVQQQEIVAASKKGKKKKNIDGTGKNGMIKSQTDNSGTFYKAKRFKSAANSETLQFSDYRLKVFGMNPKKFRRVLKYSKKKC